MIRVTRLGGQRFTVNPDLIKLTEETPDTVITLIDGSKFIVAESEDEVLRGIQEYRASIIATASLMEHGAYEPRRPRAERQDSSGVISINRNER
ncbi:flagellar FlbD family protein [Tessaracoccus sp.]